MLNKRELTTMPLGTAVAVGLMVGIYCYWPNGMIEWLLVAGSMLYSAGFWALLILRPKEFNAAMINLGVSAVVLWVYIMIRMGGFDGA